MKFIVLVLAAILSSCISQKRCIQKYGHLQKDSVVIVETIEYRDTTIILPGDTVTLLHELECDSDIIKDFEKTIKNKHATIYVAVKDGTLIAKAICDSLELTVEKYAKTISKLEKKISTTTFKEKYIPKFYKFTFWWFWITAIILILYVMYKLRLIRWLR